MNVRIPALVALAIMTSVGLTACGDDDRDEVEIEDSEEDDDD